MRKPKELEQHQGELNLGKDDYALVKLGTLKRALAWMIEMIPVPGGGMAVRRSLDGDVWSQTAQPKPFQVNSEGVVHPGLVGGVMPTLNGDPLDATDEVLDFASHSGNFKVYFKLTFSVTYTSGFLTAYTLNTVTVEHATSVPTESDYIKYLQFNTVTNGKPRASFFIASIPVQLKDAGSGATLLTYT